MFVAGGVESGGRVAWVEGANVAWSRMVLGLARNGAGRDPKHHFKLPESPAEVDKGLRGEGAKRGGIAGAGASAGLLRGNVEAGVIGHGPVKGLPNVRVLGPRCRDGHSIDGGRGATLPPSGSSGHEDGRVPGEQCLEQGDGGRFIVVSGRSQVEVEVPCEVRGALKAHQLLIDLVNDKTLVSFGKVDGDNPNGGLPVGRADGLNSVPGNQLASK
jgi:hypothetical protein